MRTLHSPGSVEHNIGVAFSLVRAIAHDPSLLEEIPDGASVVPLPADDPQQREDGQRMGLRAAEAGESVYLIQLPTLPALVK